MLSASNQRNESAVFVADAQRQRLLRASFEARAPAYDAATEAEVMFDTNRLRPLSACPGITASGMRAACHCERNEAIFRVTSRDSECRRLLRCARNDRLHAVSR
jgi:hypothetical protein